MYIRPTKITVMTATSKVSYHGNLRTEAIHLKSGDAILTDAPTDNNGKGEAFSPTDLVATSLASCMITIMGIKARSMHLNIEGTEAVIQKFMTSNPRKISKIHIDLSMPPGQYSDKDKIILERAAKTCPVALTLSQEVEQEIDFSWPS